MKVLNETFTAINHSMYTVLLSPKLIQTFAMYRKHTLICETVQVKCKDIPVTDRGDP
jgi:hypothetical protein